MQLEINDYEVGDKIAYSGREAYVVGIGHSPGWYYISYSGQGARYHVWGGLLRIL